MKIIISWARSSKMLPHLQIMNKALLKFGNHIAVAAVAFSTRGEIHVVQVDPSFKGIDGEIGKWNPLANVESQELRRFLQSMNVPVNALHSQGYVSIGCEPCTKTVLPWQHEREGGWWWEDAKAREYSLLGSDSIFPCSSNM